MDLLQYIFGADRRFVYPQMGAWGLPYTNYTMYQVYEDPQKQLEMALLMEEKIAVDFSYSLDYGVVFTETLGLNLFRPDYDFPVTLDHPIKDFPALFSLKQPDPKKDGLMPAYLESIRLIAHTINKPEMVALVGPFTLAAELAGVEDLARSLIQKPDFVEALLDFCTEMITTFLRAAVQMGAQVIQISEPTASIISPASFARSVTPRLRQIFDAAKQEGAWRVLHICGNTKRFLPEMIACGAEALSLDQVMDLPAVAKLVPAHIILAGNIDPVEVMANGTPKQVKTATTELLLAMGPYRNFMPSFGCDCIAATPEENMWAFLDTVYAG